ncbi:helix-turn-helix domain-containing protein [Brevibacillus sp. 179-C9.3 HS]|uniref:helix-turn-helix domain-containing protein n=1 Tax=unclassified Brevibacillus TaxID=2684853 RepID=UPI00399F2EE4
MSESQGENTILPSDADKVMSIKDISMDTTQKYTMKHVTDILGISDGTVRYWEKELSEFLIFDRDSQGTRQFSGQDIYKLKAINEFRGAGMSLSLIKKQLEIQRENRLHWDIDSSSFSGGTSSSNQNTGINKAEFEQMMGQLFVQIQSYIDAKMETAATVQPLLANPDQKEALLAEVQEIIKEQFTSGKEEIRTSVEEAVTSALSRVEKHRQERERKSIWAKIFG